MLDTFFSKLYDDCTGYICIALKKEGSFERVFFEWPMQRSELLTYVELVAPHGDVYFAPALFTKAKSTTSTIKYAKCFWVELDTIPKQISSLPEPSIKVSTSTGKAHWYWLLDETVPVETISYVNKSLTYLLGADISGWDAAQVLRPPDTFNYKYISETNTEPYAVLVESDSGKRYGAEDFEWLPPPPVAPPTVGVDLTKVPTLESLILKYALPEYAINIFMTGQSNSFKNEGRSGSLMELAYELAKIAMPVEDMFALLLHADNRWGKFKNRDDQSVQLTKIISVAKAKYTVIISALPDRLSSISMGFTDLLAIERNLQWIIEDLLEENGNAMITGKPGIGKSQFTLQAAAHIALGKPFLGYEIKKPTKVVFLSLEMDDLAIKKFTTEQAKSYTKDELELLNQNFRIIPLGQPLHLNYKPQQAMLSDLLADEDIKGVFIDSLSRATDQPLIDEVSTRALMGWVDSMRSNRNFFFWWVHHNRKPGGENKKPKTLDDIYGSVFITSALTSAMVLWQGPTPQTVELSFVKSRSSAHKEPFNITRDNRLVFDRAALTVNGRKIDEDDSFGGIDLGDFETFKSTVKVPRI